ncbi:uncharacterized protein LOC143300349 isoform X2 [Babylonia areolata]|uniref:uncharacterized protein LOC143300349 isoform X2 n=1 Tax=Babylonia areolata TaxID=304850 RepID=UPI003FD43E2C
MGPSVLTSVMCLCAAFCSLATTTTTAMNSAAATDPSALNLWDYLPKTWSSLCSVDYDRDPDVNATIVCHVTPHQKTRWRLADFRESLTSLVASKHYEMAVKMECVAGGAISLPFPFRAPGLVKLTVLNCRLLDKWADFATPAQQLGDWLRVQDIRNCTWVNNFAEFTRVQNNLDKMNSHYECGQDSTLVYNILQNISQETSDSHTASINHNNLDLAGMVGLADGHSPDRLNTTGFSRHNASDDAKNLFTQTKADDDTGGAIGTADEMNSTTDVAGDVLQTLVDLDNIKVQCQFEQLEVHDESFSQDTNRNHFEFMVKDSSYPELRLLNFTGIGLTEIPLELRESRRKFHGSKLGVIDISHNYIQELGVIPMYPSQGVPTTLIVRHNNITQITLSMFQDLALIPDFTVDIHGNPIACNCEMKDFLVQLHNEQLWTVSGMKYYKEHVSMLRCATPEHLSDRMIGSLSIDDLPCPTSRADLRPAMTVLVVRILMYTRVHLLLPCGLPIQPSASSPEKTYDAFVAYAHQDSEWVLGSLLKRLEHPSGNPKGRRPCKLCIHQRDFVVGKPIIDNIVDSIAASRHTIVVLTNSFVKSGWAMEELDHAYRQSIEERRRHLVVVVLEEVAKRDMGAVLRRCCKTFTYLHVADAFFWDRLLFSIQVADNISKSKKRPSLATEAGEYDTPVAGTINKGYNSDKEEGVEGPTDSSLNEDLKRMIFLETMRTVSVESTCTTVSETMVPVTPSQVLADRPLFETPA